MSSHKASIKKFAAEINQLDGTEGAVFEISDDYSNCVLLSGKLFGKGTHDKIIDIGKKYGLVILARELEIFYDRPLQP